MIQNRVELVLGTKGLGKSYSIKRALDRMQRHAPLYVWDYNREYAGPDAKDGIRDAIVFRSWPQFLAAASTQPGHLGRVVLQVGRERFAAFCRFAHRCGGCTVVLDELHDYVRSNQAANRSAFLELLTTSRHRRVNVIQAAWRAAGLPIEARSCADEIRCFRTSEPRDLDYLEELCGRDFVYKLPGLPRFRSLSWSPAGAVSASSTKTKTGPKP